MRVRPRRQNGAGAAFVKRHLACALALTLVTRLDAQLLPPNAAGVTMGHIHLNVTDVAVQTKFWVEQFGATPLNSAKGPLSGVKVPGMLILFTKQDPGHRSKGTVLDHVGFLVRSLPEMLKSLRSAGVTVESEFTGTEGFANAFVLGPDNMRIELQEDRTLPARATSHHLHFILADPQALRAWYIERFSLTPTRRGVFESADVSGENLTFQPSKTPPTIGTRGSAVDHVGFEVKNLEAYCGKLEARGVKLDVPYRKIPNLGIAVAFLTDPAGVYLELTEGLDGY